MVSRISGTSEGWRRANGPHAGRAGAVPRTEGEPGPAAWMNPTTLQRDSTLEASLQQAIANARLGRPLYAYSSVNSTMEVAHALAAEGAPEGTLVWAARQEQGRGRLRRIWASPEGSPPAKTFMLVISLDACVAHRSSGTFPSTRGSHRAARRRARTGVPWRRPASPPPAPR